MEVRREADRFGSAAGRALGRVYLDRCDGPLGGPAPETLVGEAARSGARVVLVDATGSPYGDSDGLRWLLALKSAAALGGLSVRIAARENGRVWRNVTLLRAGLDLFPSVQCAWNGAAAATAGLSGPGKGGRHVALAA